jgi:hypothetical protein
VTQELLNESEIDSGLQQLCRRSLAEHVRRSRADKCWLGGTQPAAVTPLPFSSKRSPFDSISTVDDTVPWLTARQPATFPRAEFPLSAV